MPPFLSPEKDDFQGCEGTPVCHVLPDYLCKALPYKSFNRMQTECLNTWQSDVNMLISAPTGSGKTVCFELAILRVLNQAIDQCQKKEVTAKTLMGKMVYIAPTKSLCSERAKDWQKKFEHFGLRVKAVTGNLHGSSLDDTMRNIDLVIATAEKWDSMTRGLGSKTPTKLSQQIRLLLLDEIHQVGDSRGGVYESVVTRMLVTHDTSKSEKSSRGRILPAASLRIVAVSATMSNIADLGVWLRVSEENIMIFDQSYRPVSLEYNVLGYIAKNPWLLGKAYDRHLLKVIKKYGRGKPSLIFCTSRRQTFTSAQALLDNLSNQSPSHGADTNLFLSSLSKEQLSHLVSSAKQCTHPLLRSLLPHGIAIHNADMSASTRNLIENLFRDSLIGYLFSTSTLAQGVNLPARLVVIAGTTIYKDGRLEEYQRNMLLQMCGRAGRPGLDSKGVVVIMTAKALVNTYQSIDRYSPTSISSQLEANMAEAINAEVARQLIIDVPSATVFLSSTLFSKQMHSKFSAATQTSNPNEKNLVLSVAVNSIDMLCSKDLVQYDADQSGLSCTLTGILMAKYCLTVNTMCLLKTKVPKAVSTSQIVRIVASCPELQEGISIRRSEKKRLNAMNEWIRMPVNGKVEGTTDKIVVLLQVVMGDQRNSCSSDAALRSEGQRILQSAGRVAACLVAMVLQSAMHVSYETAMAVLHVCRGMQSTCLWDGPTVLRQVPGLTATDMRALSRTGIMTLASLGKVSPQVLQRILSCTPDIVATIQKKLKAFPRFEVRVDVSQDKDTERDGLSVFVNVEVKSMQGNVMPRSRRGACHFIIIGATSSHPMVPHIFPLNEGDSQIRFTLPQEVIQVSNGWIDVTAGCSNLCGTDATIRVSIGQQSNTAQPVHREPPSRASQQTKRRLSVAMGRVTKKLFQTKLKRKDKSVTTSHSAKACLPTEGDNSASVHSVQETEFPSSDRCQVEKGQLHQQAKVTEVSSTPRGKNTETLMTHEIHDTMKQKKGELKSAPPLKPKQTPARSESHIALGPLPSFRDSSREYDDVFRALF